MTIEKFLKDNYNYNPDIKDNIKPYYKQWKSWYKGNVKSFHNYFVYNGQRKVYQKRFTMNMAKEMSEDWSDILWSEKCEISLPDESSQKQFNELINNLDLYSIINQSIERSGALGTCANVVGVYDIIENVDGMTLDVSEASTRVDIVDFDNIYPLSWNNKEVTECAFSSAEYVNGTKYIILSVHTLNDKGNYIIKNHLFKCGQDKNVVQVQNNSDVIEEFDTLSNIKWFTIYKPNLTNNIFDNSPFGIPHYANAIDNLKSVDICFDALKNEINDGRKRIFARADLFNYDDGSEKLVFDPNDTVIYQLPKNATKEDLIQSDSDSLRTTEQIDTLNMQLNILGNKVGFGENHYHFDGNNLSTATAVVSSNSKMFRRKKKLEIGYESSIYDLINAISYASSKFGKYNINTNDMVIKFDDSIIEDKESESARAKGEVTLGLISKVEYRMKIFGETEEIAKKKIADIQKETLDIQDMLGLNDNEDEENESNFNNKNDNKNNGGNK